VRITGVHSVSARTPLQGFNSETFKSATATCPGERVLSGGAKVMTATGGAAFGHVTLYSLVPGTTTYTARAAEAPEGYSEDWILVAYAICAPVSPTLEVEVVSRRSLEDWKTDPFGRTVNDVAASCPLGKKIVGTGGELTSTHNSVGTMSFQQLRPNQQGAYAFVQGVLDYNVLGGPFTVRAHAVCAFPIEGWHVVIDGTDLNTPDRPDRLQTATAKCTDQQLIGGGMTMGGYAASHLETIEPLHSGPAFQQLTVRAGVRNSFPVPPWNIAAWAICANV
jgi:hypothetical protein